MSVMLVCGGRRIGAHARAARRCTVDHAAGGRTGSTQTSGVGEILSWRAVAGDVGTLEGKLEERAVSWERRPRKNDWSF